LFKILPMNKLTLYFKGASFINNPTLHLWLNGVEVDQKLDKTGFEIDLDIQGVQQTIDLKFGLRKQQIILKHLESEDLDMELKYSRLWGNFKLIQRKRD